MKREAIDLSDERKILINMIMSTDFLRDISVIMNPTLMKSPYAKLVARWVMEYWEQYKEAPGRNIQDIYMQKSKLIQEEEDTEIISEFLSRLSKEADSFQLQNVVYSINNAIHFLKVQSLERVRDQIDSFLIEGEPVKAEQAIANYTRVEQNIGEGVSLLTDAPKVMHAFMEESDTLFTFPGALGKVAGEFTRGDLMAWLGFMKRGKTFWMWYTGYVAVFAGLKVLFCSLEMTQNEVLRRGWECLVGSPKRDKKIILPYFEPEGMKWRIAWKEETRKGVDIESIAKKQAQFKKMIRGGEIRIESFPAYSATVEDIVAHLDNLQYYDDFIPDVLIVDYADIILPSGGGREYRHQLDDIWKKLRGLAQSRNILIVTATQSGRGGANSDADEDDVAEDIRKLAHVSKMLSINRKKMEAKKGIVRIGQLAEREGSQEYEQAIVLQCLDIGRPYLDSRKYSEVIHDIEED